MVVCTDHVAAATTVVCESPLSDFHASVCDATDCGITDCAFATYLIVSK